ncbi:MAG TPA: hypothetical protein VJ372_17390 [Pyrinomonadaceae bacterium]|jgi:hypothetical protein|nr:hypothetical protein [Pyrinomonadaceae bacterium]
MESRTPKQNKDLTQREAEATDKETLQDLEDSFGSSDIDETEDDAVPSPDGAFDEDNEVEQADPM